MAETNRNPSSTEIPNNSHENETIRDWSKLPFDVLTLIFDKSGQIAVAGIAQFVCPAWWRAAKDPSLWRVVNMTDCPREEIAMSAINLAGGHITEFFAGKRASIQLLSHLADRNGDLQCLHLMNACTSSNKELFKTLCRFPKLEDIEIVCELNYGSDVIIILVGEACPQLKSFRCNRYGIRKDNPLVKDNIEAFSIARYLPNLRSVQILGNQLTIEGLIAIVDNCAHLENLDLRSCFYIDCDEMTRKRCAAVNVVKFPNDKMDEDFGFVVNIREYKCYKDYYPLSETGWMRYSEYCNQRNEIDDFKYMARAVSWMWEMLSNDERKNLNGLLKQCQSGLMHYVADNELDYMRRIHMDVLRLLHSRFELSDSEEDVGSLSTQAGHETMQLSQSQLPQSLGTQVEKGSSSGSAPGKPKKKQQQKKKKGKKN